MRVRSASSTLIALSCFCCLCCQLLGAYFICLPLRDEAGMSLGTSSLPSLFVSSLIVTLLAAPVSSALLTRTDISKGRVSTTSLPTTPLGIIQKFDQELPTYCPT